MMDLAPDRQLWQRIQQNDPDAVKALFEKYYAYLIRAGIIYTGDADLAKDAVNELFFTLWAKRATLAEPANIKAYLSTSFRNQIFLLARLHSKNVDRQEQWAYHEYMPEYSYEEVLINTQTDEEMKRKLSQALQELTPRQREYIGLKYFEELSYEQISERTGQSIKTIYNTVYEGIKLLRTKVKI
jgi:RNA polymerase sigma-70 factor (ECF subfamily)